jgi:hypothetical protein
MTSPSSLTPSQSAEYTAAVAWIAAHDEALLGIPRDREQEREMGAKRHEYINGLPMAVRMRLIEAGEIFSEEVVNG